MPQDSSHSIEHITWKDNLLVQHTHDRERLETGSRTNECCVNIGVQIAKSLSGSVINKEIC